MRNVLARGVVMPRQHTLEELADARVDLEECQRGRRTCISCKTARLCDELLELAGEGKLVAL